MARTRLTDHQLWQIVTAANDLTNAALAQALGVKTSTVHAARWRIRRSGWTCRVSYGVCPVCGEWFTRQDAAGRRVYHPGCRPIALRAWYSSASARRWAGMSAAQRQRVLDRAHRHTA